MKGAMQRESRKKKRKGGEAAGDSTEVIPGLVCSDHSLNCGGGYKIWFISPTIVEERRFCSIFARRILGLIL